MSGEIQERMLNQLNEANNKGGAACFAAYLRGAQKIYVNGLNLETRQEMATGKKWHMYLLGRLNQG